MAWAAPVPQRTAAAPLEVEQIRRFNRIVTQRVGALSDDYLARSRALGFVTDAIFGRRAPPGVPVPVALAVVAALAAVSIVVLERRVRAVEIV